MKEKCSEFLEDLESKDLSKLARWFNEKSEVWIPPCDSVAGISRILALFRSIFRRYDTLHWKMEEIYEVSSNRVFFVTQSWGITDKGMQYRNKILTDISFDEEGRIIHLSDYFKDTTVFNKEYTSRPEIVENYT